MAITTGTLTRNLRGTVGDLIFRNYNGKTVVSPRPVYKNESNTPGRKQARGHFREATWFARIAMRDAKQKLYYKQKAKQLKLPNAYTAAITDYLRKAKVLVSTRSSFSPKKGAAINIIVSKAFKVDKANAILLNEKGDILSQQSLPVVNAQKNAFKYTFTDNFPDCVALKIVTGEPCSMAYTVNVSEFIVV